MATREKTSNSMRPTEPFSSRHIGPLQHDLEAMLELLGISSLDELVERAIPEAIRTEAPLEIGSPRSEDEILAELG